MEMTEYHKRKAERTKKYFENLHMRLKTCCACNGSGRYDHNGSPKCSSCDGTGKERYKASLGTKFQITAAGESWEFACDDDLERLFALKEKFERKFKRKYVVKNMAGQVLNNSWDHYKTLLELRKNVVM